MTNYFTSGDVVTIAILGLTGLIAYFGWQRAVDSKFAILDKSVADKFNAIEKSFDSKFAALAIQINTIMMRDVESLNSRMTATESDAVEVHKRFHTLANDINGLGLKLDRLERPRA